MTSSCISTAPPSPPLLTSPLRWLTGCAGRPLCSLSHAFANKFFLSNLVLPPILLPSAPFPPTSTIVIAFHLTHTHTMPSGDSTPQAKRPVLGGRSSSSVSFANAKSPSESLSSSVQRRAPQRHVAHSRTSMGPRVPSLSRNASKQSKANLVQLGNAEVTSPLENGQVKRNSSNVQLPRNVSATALKKNHSETSLKKNRSSGQLTKLPRAGSSKHISRGSKGENRPKRSLSSARVKQEAEEELDHPTVRFDLADDGEDNDEGWVEETLSQSPSTKANTARNSMINEDANAESGNKPQQLTYPASPASPTSPRSPISPDEPDEGLTLRLKSNNGEADKHKRAAFDLRQDSKRSDSSKITSRLLQRNPSHQITPQVSDISAAVVKAEAHPSQPLQTTGESGSHSTSSTVQDNSGQELVSRFLNGSGSSETPRNGNFLRPNNIDENDENDKMRRNQSVPDFARRHSRSDSLPVSGGSPAIMPPPSRTQQKLWLERDLSNIEPQQPARAPAFLRPNRLSGLGLPIYPGNSETRFSSQQRQLHDQIATEYNRVRLYQSPLAAAVVRLEGKTAPRSRAAPTANPRISLNGDGFGDSSKGLSQSWRSQRSARSSMTVQEKPGNSETPRRNRVRFGAANLPSDGDTPRRSLDGATEVDDGSSDTRKDEARDICRRMWELNPVAGSGD